MFKNVIAPVQAWLLSQGRCVGCGTDLSAGKTESVTQGLKVTCSKCGRVFIKEQGTGKFRRALLQEA
jgi:predicted  nucleic acid-binding Zn-ribbon protein